MPEKRFDDMQRSEAENDLLAMMYRGTTTIQEVQWEQLPYVPLMALITPNDIAYLRKLITSPRYSGNSKAKIEKMDELMHYRGFTKFAGGTNRIVYIHPNAPYNVFKVAIDIVGIKDNPAEYRNQYLLKPYCCRVFECSPCGTIASFEKVDRITTFDEFYSIAEDYYYLITQMIIGKYVMDDIGINYFMNIGIRKGFGVVLLDFPYLYELDGSKLHCNKILDNNIICNGEIDYDAGFNNLVCSKCGKTYVASELAKPVSVKNATSFSFKKGGSHMKLLVNFNDGSEPFELDTLNQRKTLARPTTIRPVVAFNNPQTPQLIQAPSVTPEQSPAPAPSETHTQQPAPDPQNPINEIFAKYDPNFLMEAVKLYQKAQNQQTDDDAARQVEAEMSRIYKDEQEALLNPSKYLFPETIIGNIEVEFVKELPKPNQAKYGTVYLISQKDIDINKYKAQHPVNSPEDIEEDKFHIYHLSTNHKFIRYVISKTKDGKSYLKPFIPVKP